MLTPDSSNVERKEVTMAFDEEVARRLRVALNSAAPPEVVERKMFGGLAMMVNGHMCIGVNGDELMVRVGNEAHADALAQPHAREMDFTGKPLRGFVYVAPPGFASEEDLNAWVDRGLDFVQSMPPK